MAHQVFTIDDTDDVFLKDEALVPHCTCFNSLTRLVSTSRIRAESFLLTSFVLMNRKIKRTRD